MNKILAVTFCLTFSLSMPIRANADGAPPSLASADWSVNGTHNLASNPPSLDAVQDFFDGALGVSDEFASRVCEFRFADLRNSGNLSLITTVNPGGRQWPECNQLYIFDRTPPGFEHYETDRAYGDDLAHSVLDINHDGRHELVLWGELAPVASGLFNRNGLGCDAKWPLVFAWTGNGYSEVSDQYKDYYRNYLKSLEAQVAAYSSESVSAAAQKANPASALGDEVIAQETRRGVEFSVGPGGEGPATVTGLVRVAPAPTPEAAQIPEAAPTRPNPGDYSCTRIEAAKTEAFLGIDLPSTMSAAITDSKSADPNERILAAAIFSYLGSQEAKANLYTLSNDADSRVADIAKKTASIKEDPAEFYRRMIPE
jgi:hypothetical protein